MGIKTPVPDNFFADGDRIFVRPHAELNRTSLPDILNALRMLAFTKGYYVDPDNSDSFADAEEAYNQGREDIPENGTIIISFAPGKKHQLGFELKNTHDVVFLGLDNGQSSYFMSTVLEGDIDFEETPSVATVYERQLVVSGVQIGYGPGLTNWNPRNYWRMKLSESILVYFKCNIFNGLTKGVGLDVVNCYSNANVQFKVAVPHNSMQWLFSNSEILVSGSPTNCDFQINKGQAIFNNCQFPTFIPEANCSMFDLLNSDAYCRFENCGFGFIQFGDAFSLMKNAANANVIFEGETIFYDKAYFMGSWAFGIPTAKMQGMPFLKNTPEPLDNPPPGTRRVDVGNTWTVLSWNGVAWV